MTGETVLKEWQSRLEVAKSQYASERENLKKYRDYYNGERILQTNPNTGQAVTKKPTNIRSAVYELIESQIDSSIPMPKVRAIHAEDVELAKKIERMLENKIRTCNLITLNDAMERTVYTQGGSYFLVQWDEKLGLHCEIGDLKISEVTPRKLIPQPGVTELAHMDYFFVQEAMTKKSVKALYDVDVSDAENDDPDIVNEKAKATNEVVTVNTAFYKSKEGIGCFVWCDTYILMDIEDFQARQLDHCEKCGSVMQDGKCPKCGGTKAKKMPDEYEELADGLEVMVDGGGMRGVDPYENVPELDENGEQIPLVDEMGMPTGEMKMRRVKKKIPYYKPCEYPVILRRNITKEDKLLGGSDVAVVMDQQDTISKLGSKLNEKLLKGGSYVTLPRDVDVETTDKELKIIRLNDPAQKQMIDVLTIQADVRADLNYLETNYQWMKSVLGITDSFQGKYDASAISGTAKQYSINQAAGRLESKRTLKNEAYASLYRMMFKFWLAYADQNTSIQYTDTDGADVFDHLNRHDFLKMDASGEFYWNDEFIFETDPTSTLMMNREALWQQADMALQSGAFGQLGDLETSRLYWQVQEANGKPGAAAALKNIEDRIAKQEEMANAMSAMQNGNANQIQQAGAPI